MLHNVILAFTKFPGAESIHLIQGVIAGILLTQGYIHKCIARVGIALFVMVAFAVYEGYERWRIQDNADVDFQVMLITAWISAIITLAFYIVRQLRDSG